MTSLLPNWHRALLPALLLLSGASMAQQVVSPLPADPARAAYQPASKQTAQRTTALTLPFFDDFTTPLEGQPSSLRWLPGGGTFVSNRLAINPPTRGAVTFDGLRANGSSYSNSVSNIYTNIDTLTSQPIDLAGMMPGDSVYLSFAFQTGNIVGGATQSTSSTPVNLNLQFRNNTGRWATAPGWLTAPNFLGRSTGVPTTPFRQFIVAINQAQYLHGNFQFRFLATGNSSQATDTWSVDYVLLDRSRGPSPTMVPDTTFQDVATSTGVAGSGNLARGLRRYTAMPVWQFNAASTQANELNNQLSVKVMNLNAGQIPLPVNVLGTVRELNSGTTLGTWLSRQTNLTTIPRVNTITGDASTVAIPTTPQPKRLRYQLAIQSLEQTPRTLPNDTIFYDVELNNYYAYDDGSAEAVINIIGTPGIPSSVAYRYDLNQPDRVRGVRLYPVFTAGDTRNRTLTVQVWADNNGTPGAILGSKTVVVPNPLPSGWQYYEATFDTPVAVNGVFHAGFSQAYNPDLQYGFDLNNTVPVNYSWRNTNGTWVPTGPSIRAQGTLMMRPVMNNNIATSTSSAQDTKAFVLYPNPAHSTVEVDGPAFARAAVLDALGRTVWEQPAAQAGQRRLDLTPLAPGLYIVRLTLPDGHTATRRLVLE